MPQVENANVVTRSVIILGPIPASAISLVLIWPAAVAIAFGGVPTGKWNEKEQHREAGIIKYSGCIRKATHWKKQYINT